MSQTQIKPILDSINHIILGKQHTVKLALTCLLARGHLLIEDLPGVGKTTLAHTLAATLGLSFQRIQFTSDMLPADILGVSIYDQQQQQFTFHRGPIFTHLLLADEVNRASPRTQSALLEAMEEQQVTIEGETFPLNAPFFVIATQNPLHQIGTFALPESQLDRFLMRIEMGYPDKNAERALLKGEDRHRLLHQQQAITSTAQLLSLQQQVNEVIVSDALVEYVQAILALTRDCGQFVTGLSPRAGLAIIRAAKAWAFISERDYVLPEDVQAVLPSVITHRLQPVEAARSVDWITQLLSEMAIP